MSNLPNSKAVKDAPTTLYFFPQLVFSQGLLSDEVKANVVPGSGIPALDYFAAHALACVEPETQSSAGAAQWAYRVAVEMIAERERRLRVSPVKSAADNDFIPE